MTAPYPTAGERVPFINSHGCLDCGASVSHGSIQHASWCPPASSPAVAASTGTSEDVEALVAWLVEQGGSPGSSLHSWRCEYPDRYGECDCLAESARDLLASDWLAAHDAATAAAAVREVAADSVWDHEEHDVRRSAVRFWLSGQAHRIAREQAR